MLVLEDSRQEFRKKLILITCEHILPAYLTRCRADRSDTIDEVRQAGDAYGKTQLWTK